MTQPSSLRFFMTLPLHAPYALIVLAAIVVVSIWTVILSPGELDSGLGMVLFIQMFLASTGFVPAARRGQFDPVLVRSRRVARVAVSHWLVSIGPGVIAWMATAIVAYACGSAVAESAMFGRRAAALFLVSALGWSAGFLFARGTAGVVWIAALVLLLMRRVALIAPNGTFTALTTLQHAGMLVLCPFLLVGSAPVVAPGAVPLALAAAATAVIAVCRRASELDVPLGSDA